jgi:hypothetical protein
MGGVYNTCPGDNKLRNAYILKRRSYMRDLGVNTVLY